MIGRCKKKYDQWLGVISVKFNGGVRKGRGRKNLEVFSENFDVCTA